MRHTKNPYSAPLAEIISTAMYGALLNSSVDVEFLDPSRGEESNW